MLIDIERKRSCEYNPGMFSSDIFLSQFERTTKFRDVGIFAIPATAPRDDMRTTEAFRRVERWLLKSCFIMRRIVIYLIRLLPSTETLEQQPQHPLALINVRSY